MKIAFAALLWTQLLWPTEAGRIHDSLAVYLESHDLAGVGNTKECFSSYLPQLEQVGTTWSTEYNACLQDATTLRATVLTKVQGMQETLRQAALGIDSYIVSCVNIADVLEYFDCFAKLSKQQLTNMYTISFNASESALSLTQQLNSVDVERYQCTNRTEQSYVRGTARIFNALDNCLQQAADDLAAFHTQTTD